MFLRGYTNIQKLIDSTFTTIDYSYALLSYIGLGIFALLLVDIYTATRNSDKAIRIKAWLIIISITVTLSLVEVLFRATNYLATYTETRTGFYHSYFLAMEKGWFHVHEPGLSFKMQGPEFSYPRKANSLGLSDYEPVVEKDTGEIRLITLGDSFTEGDGAPFDSSYPQQVKQLLGKKYSNRKFSLINAGVFGSDPYFDYILLKERLLKYKPDLIVISLSTGDLYDIYYRGNMSRFKPTGKVEYNHPPWWEPIYAVSRFFRLIIKKIGYDSGLVYVPTKNALFNNQKNGLKELLVRHNTLAVQNNYRVIALLRPDKAEVINGRFYNGFEDMKTLPQPLERVQMLDLLDFYTNSVGISAEDVNLYYWPQDGHHTPMGYTVMAKGTVNSIIPLVDSL